MGMMLSGIMDKQRKSDNYNGRKWVTVDPITLDELLLTLTSLKIYQAETVQIWN
jgi:hypothetical protein